MKNGGSVAGSQNAGPGQENLERSAMRVIRLAAKAPKLSSSLSLLWALRTNQPAHRPFARMPTAEATAASALSLGLDGPRRAERSVVFLHHSYYHFYYLAAALRARGWDAVSVSLEPPDGKNHLYYHGEDINLYDPVDDRFQANLAALHGAIRRRFRMVHFAGDGMMGVFPENRDEFPGRAQIPWDFLDLKRHGVKIGYTISGCNDGQRQSAVQSWTNGLCDKCIWQIRPEGCSERRSELWGRKLDLVCDLIAVETDWALDYRKRAKAYHEPLTMCVDPDVWRPDVEIPEPLRLPRAEGELIVYHAVGNFRTRADGERNIKGTPAVVDAVERLKDDGIPVRLEFVTNRPNTEVRMFQAQADVIVDQLNYGRYGATAREAMMLGKPTICYIDPRQEPPLKPLRSLAECPLVSATEDTVYAVLKDLLLSPGKRARLGTASRAYAMKWHSPEACADRYERVYDRMLKGRPLEADNDFETDRPADTNLVDVTRL